MVRLQSRSAHPEAREALDKTLARIMAVGRVHEPLSKTTGEVGRFDAGVYAQALAEELVASMGRDDIRLETMVEPARRRGARHLHRAPQARGVALDGSDQLVAHASAHRVKQQLRRQPTQQMWQQM